MNRFPLFMLLLAGVGRAWAQSAPAQAVGAGLQVLVLGVMLGGVKL